MAAAKHVKKRQKGPVSKQTTGVFQDFCSEIANPFRYAFLSLHGTAPGVQKRNAGASDFKLHGGQTSL